MNTPGEPEDELNEREVRRLNELIRASRDEDDADAAPDDELLAAYLEGRGTPDEVNSMHRNLERSARLRDEVVYTAGLYRQDVQTRFDSTPGRALPPLEGETERPRAQRVDPKDFQPRPRRKSWLPRPLVWGGLLPVAAGMIAILIWRPWSPPETHWMAEGSLSMEQFVEDPLRGGTGELPEPENAQEAAIRAYIEAIGLSNGEFHIAPGEGIPKSGGTPVRVEFEGASGAYEAVLPADASGLDVWFLAIPALTLHRFAMSDNRAAVSLPPDATRGAVTVSASTSDGLFAAPAREIRRN